MKTKTKLIIIFSIAATVISALGLYVYLQIYLMNHLRSDGLHGLLISKEEKYFYQKLKELKPFNPSGKETIPLKELTNFEWDEVLSKETYSPTEERTYIIFYKNGKTVQKINSYGFYFYKIVKDNGFISFDGRSKKSDDISNVKVGIQKRLANGTEVPIYSLSIINN